MIEVSNLSKSFGGVKVLNNLNLCVKKGSVYGLLGPNGSGKTTLIKHLAGIYKQNSGTVKIEGEPVYENPSVKNKIIYISDDLYFFSQYSIEEIAHFYAGHYPAWNYDRYESLKQVFPIDPKKRAAKLSKGMQKQVAFWLGICAMPKIMILDEPVDGLDPVMRKKVWSLMLQDVAEHETTILVSSHNLRELEDVCDHVGILHNGEIVVESEIDNMKSDIHKIQIAFKHQPTNEMTNELNILHQSQNGSVCSLIIKGNRTEVLAAIQKHNPVILDVLPLTLEEIFIYELGGIGYDFKSILI